MALMLAMVIPYRYFMQKWATNTRPFQISFGLFFGLIAILGMLVPMTLAPGLIFDARSVVISLGGFFGGPLAAVIMWCMAVLYRMWIGGVGVFTGIGVITTSALLGCVFHELRKKHTHVTRPHFIWGFGLLVNVCMLLWMLTLPDIYSWDVLRRLSLPVLLIFPLGTMFLGKMLVDEEMYEKTKETLRESERRVQLIVEASGIGLWDWDLRTHQMYYSPQWKKQLGYDDQEIKNQFEEWETRVHPDDLDRQLAMIKSYLDHPWPDYETEVRMRHKDGTYRWILVRADVLKDASGNPYRMVGAHLDITQRKQNEGEQLHLGRLRTASALSAGVSHNLNNILTGVLGPAQLLLMKSQDPEIREEAEEIFNAAKRARDLVHRLHLSTQNVEDDVRQEVDVHEVIRDAVRVARPRWKDEPEARGIQILVETQLQDRPFVMGSPSRLHDIFINLIFNAVDAMPQGGTIHIQTQMVPEGVEVVVRDTGVGIDPAIRDRIFEPFFTTKMDVGSGLGLSTVYATVTKWQGSIRVDSTLGEGTTFTLFFPKGQEDA